MEDTSQCHRFSVNNAALHLKLVVDIHSLCLSNNGVSVTAVPTATLCAINCIHSPITAMMTRMITIIPTINPTSGPVTGIAVGSLPMQKLPSLVWHAGGEYIVKMTAWYEMIGNKNPLTAHFTDKGEFRYATRCWEHLQPPSTGSEYHTIL